MEELLRLLSKYDVFTSLYPGYLFVLFSDTSVQTYVIALHDKSVFLGLAYCYFMGMIINRIGSLVLEGILRKIGFLKFAPYSNYISAILIDKDIKHLSEINNAYRSLSAVFFVLILVKVLPACLVEYVNSNFLFFMFVITLWSYRKQTEYVVDRIEKALDKK